MSKFTWEEQRDGLLIDLAASLSREDALSKQLAECERERNELMELLNHALSYTCCAAYSPSLTQEINAALAKVGADKKGEV